MAIARREGPVTVSCPSCGAEITISDTTEEFITCSHCCQVHQISDLLKETNSQHIGRIRYKHYLFPLRKLEQQEDAEEAKEAFEKSTRGILIKRVIICLLCMLPVSLIFGLWRLIPSMGISLACWILYWHIASGKGSAEDQRYLKPLAAGGIFFLILMLFM